MIKELTKSKFIIINVFLFTYVLINFFITITFGWSYPIQKIYKGNCTPKIESISGEICSYDLPLIKNADYNLYRNNREYRKVYTVLRGATYFDGRDIGLGSHQGVDIATNEGTPVYSIGDGIVTRALYAKNRGKLIVIKHERKGNIIHSSYVHLSEIDVKEGEIINKGQLIGKVGSTGNSSGPHLQFQIDINTDGKNPFFYKGCEGEIKDIVNTKDCQVQMYKNTVDPILFIETNGAIIKTNNVIKDNQQEDVQINYTLQKNDIKIDGFVGGILNYNETQIIKINNQINGGKLIINNTTNLEVFPKELELMGNERKIFITQKNNSSQIGKIELIYNGNIIAKLFTYNLGLDFNYITTNNLNITNIDIGFKKISKIY